MPAEANRILPSEVQEIQSISAVPQILETVASMTGLGFVAIAHVTEDSWTTCAVLDKLNFGLNVGDGLDVTTTLCEEVRESGSMIVIDHVFESERYRDHHTPRIYGFQSYFSIPLFRADGAYFGTLCGLDPRPMQLSGQATVSTLTLFAELISKQLDAERKHSVIESDLRSEREVAELREQFIAVLGHDLRTPLGAFQHGLDLLNMKHSDPQEKSLLARMQRSVGRMNALVDDVVDFARGRMGGGIGIALRRETALETPFGQVVDELRELHPAHSIIADIQPGIALHCDAPRLGQLLSNLLKNALVHGAPGTPVRAAISAAGGKFTIEVSNGGAALAPELVAQLFKPFWRGPSSDAREGLGLGLYIVSEIAKSHGGAIDVSSRDGLVVFRFSMPLDSTAGLSAA